MTEAIGRPDRKKLLMKAGRSISGPAGGRGFGCRVRVQGQEQGQDAGSGSACNTGLGSQHCDGEMLGA